MSSISWQTLLVHPVLLHSRLQYRSTRACPATLRHASLSAIHRGLRRSERAQSANSRPLRHVVPRHAAGSYGALNRTAEALNGASSPRQQQKLQKKLNRKVSEIQDDDGTGRPTRRKRFLDPDYSFGKRSLVYQLRHGSLRSTAASVSLQEPIRPHQYPSSNDFGHRSERADPFMDSSATEKPPTSRRRRREDSDTGVERRAKSRETKTMTIAYTTAASQFLYGKSVIKAALMQGRREMYKLYVRGDDNHVDSRDKGTLMHLAKSRDIPVVEVPDDGQRLMDKMSMGRPHNGFVLEASPLPQLPIKYLGRWEQGRGFYVELDHQTKEQRAVNGENSFISTQSGNASRRPLFLLLHEILDPGNLGALLRTASYMGVDAIGITGRHTSALTPVALKAAVGAAEEITIVTVTSVAEFLANSRAAGWKTYAAVAPPEAKLFKMHSTKFVSTEDIELSRPLEQDPCVLVLGNEGHGLPRSVKVAADFELSVPKFLSSSSVDSLNVSVAAGLLCHAFIKGFTPGKNADKLKKEHVGSPQPEVVPEEDKLF